MPNAFTAIDIDTAKADVASIGPIGVLAFEDGKVFAECSRSLIRSTTEAPEDGVEHGLKWRAIPFPQVSNLGGRFAPTSLLAPETGTWRQTATSNLRTNAPTHQWTL